MEWWHFVLILLGAVCVVFGLLAIAGFLLWRRASGQKRHLSERVVRLPWRSRFRLAWLLLGDQRVPLPVRAILPVLVLYLAMPLDLVPDFIPLIGMLDDLLVIFVAFGLLLHLVPVAVIESLIDDLEAGPSQDAGP